MTTIKIVRSEPRLDIFPVLTVLERKVYVDKKRTRLGVRTRLEHQAVIEHIRQSHALVNERRSGLGLPFDRENPRFILIPSILPKNRVPWWVRARYDHDIVYGVRKNPDGSVDMRDLKRKRSAARLKRWGRTPVETWSVFTITSTRKPPQPWTDELTFKKVLGNPFYRGVVCRRDPGTPNILALRQPSGRALDRGHFGLTVGDGFDCERKLERSADPERFGPCFKK
ncbi:MAG TPA: hypothetical protein VMC43_01205 [Candidatus Paceibacterota bacterium]|nr:hypothetical protein [Candidatus Paceibacterota bacterium]